MARRNAIYAQSGGVTAVINTTAAAVIQAAAQAKSSIGKVLAARNGVLGVLREELVDTSKETASAIKRLSETPGGAFGSCRYKLQSASPNDAEMRRLFDVFAAHNVGYFFYNGGGDSQDTCTKISNAARALNFDIACIGIPKTVDNDLAGTDTCPGFGSVAKYVAVSVREAALDVASMAETSTKVFIMEVMGRHAGWIAAAGGLAGEGRREAPHLILFPEIEFDPKRFLAEVQAAVRRNGYCVVVASEGIRTADGRFVAESGTVDAFGHTQLGGVAAALATLVKEQLGLKHHYAVADYLQRSARHIASKVDVDQAYAVGKKAVQLAAQGQDGVMISLQRTNDEPYRWRVASTPLAKVANKERKVPRSFITGSGYGITQKARKYLAPLIGGEAFPRFTKGLPNYVSLKNELVQRRLPRTKDF